MKKINLVFLLFFAINFQLFSKNITVTVSNFNSSNNTIPVDANVGDVITFIVGSTHTATKVSKTTWDAGLSIPLSGGFDINGSSSSQSITLTSNDVGTIYFVCKPHASFGMKGIINVSPISTDLNDIAIANPELSIYPNPSEGILQIHISGTYETVVRNITGVELQKRTIVDNATLDISILPQGIYFISLSNGDKTLTKKIVKR